mgnify:CR=1 FL=1
MISSDRKDCFIRYGFDGKYLYSSRSQGRYNYYRWFVDSNEWVQIFTSDSKIEEIKFIRNLDKSGDDFKVCFELEGAIYIMKPYIVLFPKENKSNNGTTLASVRTWPSILMDDAKSIDLNNWKNISFIEAEIDYPDNISITDYKQFHYTSGDGIKNKIVEKLKKVFSSSNINYKNLKIPVRWFIKLDKQELAEYNKLLKANKTNRHKQSAMFLY